MAVASGLEDHLCTGIGPDERMMVVEVLALKLPYAQPDPWHIPPRHGYFSVMGGPTPYPIVDTFDSVSDDEFPWRAIPMT